MKFNIPSHFLSSAIGVNLVGVGGTGSHVLAGLARIHMSMLALGHPAGLDVCAWDPDKVTDANVGRQLYAQSDVGQYKSIVSIHRINAYYGTNWSAVSESYSGQGNGHWRRRGTGLLIGCVDTRKARRELARAMEHSESELWLDFGNDSKTGQVILGERARHWNGKTELPPRLPTVMELFRELNDAAVPEDDTPSCSLAGALLKQDLFINQTVASLGLNMLWSLLRNGFIEHHGYFVNLEAGSVQPLAVDEATWKRFGYVHWPKPPVRKVVKVSGRSLHLECGHDVHPQESINQHPTTAQCGQCQMIGQP